MGRLRQPRQENSLPVGKALTWLFGAQQLLLAGIIALLVGSWLGMARFSVNRHAPLEILLIDTSASTRLGQADADRWLTDQGIGWLAAASSRYGIGGPDPDMIVATFGPSASTLSAPGKPAAIGRSLRRFLGTRPLAPRAARKSLGQASPLDAALALIEGDCKGRPSVRLTLLGDGSYSGVDPTPRLEAWAASGISFEIITPPRDQADLALSDLIAPPRSFAGAKVIAGLTVTPLALANAPGAPALRVRATFAGLSADWFEPLGSLGASGLGRTVQVDLTRPFWGATLEDAEGELNFEITAGFLVAGKFEPDHFGANDLLAGTVVIGTPARILVAVTRELQPAAEAFFGQTGGGFSFTFAEPAKVALGLGTADALISYDLSPDELPTELVKSFVDGGGGWFALGGWGLLADRNVHIELGLRHLLPLGIDDDAPLRHVILMVDGSGSMDGDPFEVVRRGALELVNAAPATDEVRLVFFTDALGVENRIRPSFAGEAGGITGGELMRRAREAENDLAALMSTGVPGGNTYLVGALRELVALRGRGLQEALVLLLTDGQETRYQKNDPTEPERQRRAARSLSDSLSEAKARLVVIGVGKLEPGSDPDLFLHALLQPGEDLVRCGLEVGDEKLLGELLRREVNRDRILEGNFQVSPASRGDGFAELLLPVAEGQSLPGVRRLGRYSLQSGATLLAVTAVGEPLLAAQRRRVGRVAALATLPSSEWAPEWTSAKPLRSLLTWLADGPGPRNAKLYVTTGSAGKLVLEGIPSSDTEIGLDLEIRPISLGKEGHFVPAIDGPALAVVRVLPMAGPPGIDGDRLFEAPLPAVVADALAAGKLLQARVMRLRREVAEPILATLPIRIAGSQSEGHPRRPHVAINAIQTVKSTMGTPNRDRVMRGPGTSPKGAHPAFSAVMLAGLLLVFAGGLKAFGPIGR